MNTNGCLEEYILNHIGKEDPYLHNLYRQTHLHLTRPRMASGHLQGKLLRMFTQMINPKMVLEIGTYSGYSALSMASALQEGAELHTFEIDDEQAFFTLPFLQNSPWGDKIFLHQGDVVQRLPLLAQEKQWRFDLVFIDGDKRQYVDYYYLVLPLLREGGYIIADNTLWDGHVVEDKYDTDPQTRGIKQFNALVNGDESVEKVIIPLRDGLTLIKKK